MSENLSKLTFQDATIDQVKEFFEWHGWGDFHECLYRTTDNGCDLNIWADGDLILEHSGGSLNLAGFRTLGEALDAANELANTKAFGGWRP